MTGPRFTTILALLLSVVGCTEPNPGFQPSSDLGSCTPGERTCSSDKVMVCTHPEAPRFELERTCPGGSTCREGLCVASGAPCEMTCADGQVCTVFAVPGTTRLGTFCATPLGGTEGGLPCSKNEECRSGLCIRGGKYPLCYRACGKATPCGAGLRCAELTLTINGVHGTVAGCLPL